MTPVEITSLFAGIFAVLSSTGVTIYTTKAKKVIDTRQVETVNWKEYTTSIQEERNSLLLRVDKMETLHQEKIKAVEVDYTAQLTAARIRITQLENEVNELYKRLVQQSSP